MAKSCGNHVYFRRYSGVRSAGASAGNREDFPSVVPGTESGFQVKKVKMNIPTNPSFELTHHGHVEVYTDRFEESGDFFTRVYGLKLSGQDGTSAYMRAWEDYGFHLLKLSRHDRTGVSHIANQASSPEALERRVAAIEGSDFKAGIALNGS